MADIILERVNNRYIKVVTDQSIAMDLTSAFTFEIPNAQFHPKVKARIWDGKIRLLDFRTRQIYSGLAPNIIDWANKHGYSCEYEGQPAYNVTDEKLNKFIDWLKPARTPRPYQFDAFAMAVRETRRLFVSPTASGKSFMIYLTARYVVEKFKRQVLIIVPSTQLVSQLYKDFVEYNNDSEDGLDVWQIRDGADKRNDHSITITTWQAIQKQPAAWYKPFSAVVGDEVHTFSANSLRTIMERCDAPLRFGFTGTLDGSETNELVLQGMFGKVHQVITYKELREAGYIADAKIKCIVLKHSDSVKKSNVKAKYPDEMKVIAQCPVRRKFILDLVGALSGNILCLYQNIDGHLIPTHEEMLERFGKDRVNKIHGSIKTDVRESIREAYDGQRGSILNASYGTFQQGINIVNIDHIICASPTKSRIRLLQSMGRGLRRSKDKTKVTIWDIADDLSWKSWKNHTLSHLKERVQIYNREEFDYELIARTLRYINDNND